MKSVPIQWTAAELANDSVVAASRFRSDRLAASDSWETHYRQARDKFELPFQKLDDLDPSVISHDKIAETYRLDLGEALRYLAGPPISDDDLQVIAEVNSIAPGQLRRDPEALRKVFKVIERVVDPHRFPWVASGSTPTQDQREAALLASSVLLAAQRVATQRRNEGKENQETKLKACLCNLGFTEVAPVTINTIVKGPQAMQFCAECPLGERKADVVVRLHDTRLLAIECKASNSATNSVKHLNNDAAAKAEYWIKQFGIAQVVPAAVLAGVFKVLNLEQAQARGLSLFWSHDLGKLGAYIESTR